jgi:hypothetical protein
MWFLIQGSIILLFVAWLHDKTPQQVGAGSPRRPGRLCGHLALVSPAVATPIMTPRAAVRLWGAPSY